MYSPDTLKRLDDEEVRKYQESMHYCEFCDNPADHIFPIYNPADAVREPPVEGAYCTAEICNDCFDSGILYESYFQCPDCGEWFIINHSWDVVAVTLEDGMYCQKCAAENLEPLSLSELYNALEQENTKSFIRINTIPGKEKLWSGEYSPYSDFPGHTSFDSVLDSIKEAAANLDMETMVYPIVDHGFQFGVSLAVYY